MRIEELLEVKISDDQKEAMLEKIYWHFDGNNYFSSAESRELFRSLYSTSPDYNCRFSPKSSLLSLSAKWNLLTSYMQNPTNQHRNFCKTIKKKLEEVLSETNTDVRSQTGRLAGKKTHGLFLVRGGVRDGFSCGVDIATGVINYTPPGLGELLTIPIGIPAILISTLVGFGMGISNALTRAAISVDEQKLLFARLRQINSLKEKERIIAKVVDEYNNSFRCVSHSSFELMQILVSRWIPVEVKFNHLVEYMIKNIGNITENNGKRLFLVIKNAILKPENGDIKSISRGQATSRTIYNSIFINGKLDSKEEKLFFNHLSRITSETERKSIIENVIQEYEKAWISPSESSTKLIENLKSDSINVRKKFGFLRVYMESPENNGKKLFSIIKKEVTRMGDSSDTNLQYNAGK
jgi:hypothetical protein